YPFAAFVAVIIVSNLAGSFFNFFYNTQLIVERDLNEAQRAAFWWVAAPAYNLIAYPAFFMLLLYLLRPVRLCFRRLRGGEPIDTAHLEYCRRRLVNFPVIQLTLNPVAWLPGAIIFPWVIGAVGGPDNLSVIWSQFIVSFLVSTVFTTVQTFFVIQAYLTA